ncbi:MAG: MFS transporter [Chlamydiia bacterium]|nr:MFS transporter [Chlamydiia bacterium]
MDKQFNRTITFFTLYLIFFLDLAGVAIVLVVFSPVILQANSPLIASETTLHTRNLIVGFLFAAYPLTQFFGAPLIGELSDRYGRRPVLLISNLGTTLAFALTAYALDRGSLVLVFIGRLAAGLFAGNLTVAQAGVSDLSAPHDRPRRMALFSAVGGIAWMVAPYIGSLSSDDKFVSWFSYSTPFWMMAALFFIILLFLLFFVQECLSERERSHEGKNPFLNLISVFKLTHLRTPLLLGTLVMLGWMFFEGFIGTYLIQKFHFTEVWIGNAFAFFALFWFLGGLFANVLVKKLSPDRLNIVPLIFASLSMFIIGLATKTPLLWIFAAVANFAMANVLACFFGIFTKLAPEEELGKVFGLWTAGFALFSAIGPPFAGWISRYALALPFYVAGLWILLIFFLYLKWLFIWRNRAEK